MTVTDPQARLFDPDTSKAAARGEHLGDAAMRVLRALVALEIGSWIEGGRGFTANEIRDWLDGQQDRGSVARRLTSLRRHGLVLDSGERRDGGRGVQVIVWKSTRAGRAWLKGEA